MEKLFHTIGQGIVAGALFVGSLLGYHQAQNVGANVIYTPVPRYESSLALALTATQTSTMNLVSGVDGNGQTLTGPMCFTLDSGAANSVEDLCGVASGTVVSNLVRGIDSTGYNSSSTLAHAHRVGADVKTTDSPYLPQYYQLLSGNYGFPNLLIYDSAIPSSSFNAPNQLIDKAYADALSFAGAPNGNTTTKGVYEEATQLEIASGTQSGSTGAHLVIPASAASKTASTTPVVVVASGTIGATFLASANYSLGSTTVQSLVSQSTTFSGNVTQSSGTTALASTTINGLLTINGAVSSSASFLTEVDGSSTFLSSSTSNTQTSTIVTGWLPKIIGISGGFTCDASNGSGNFNQTTGGSPIVNSGGLPIGGFNYSTQNNSAGGGQVVVVGIGAPSNGFSCNVGGTVIGQQISVAVNNITSTGFSITVVSTEITGTQPLVPGTIYWYALK